MCNFKIKKLYCFKISINFKLLLCRASWWNRSNSIGKWLTSLRPFTGSVALIKKTTIVILSTQHRNCWDAEGGESMPPPPPAQATPAPTPLSTSARLVMVCLLFHPYPYICYNTYTNIAFLNVVS